MRVKEIKNIFNQRGLTLIELMVSLVIGLLLAIIASSTYLYSKQAYNTVSETSQMEESGRFALNLLARNIQSAGYVAVDPEVGEPEPKAIKVFGCDFGMVRPNGAGSISDLDCLASLPAGTTQSGSIAMFYQTDAFNTTGASFQGVDCIGNRPVELPGSTATSTNTFEVRSYFFISSSTVSTPNGTTSMGQLSCVTDSTGSAAPTAFPAQPLIPGIHQLRAFYLKPTSGADGAPAQLAYDASAVEASAVRASTLPITSEWSKIVSVELCVLTKSIQPSGNDTGATVTDCYDNTFTPPANQSYRRFMTTVSLRNRTINK